MSANSELLLGRVVGNWRLKERIGSGSFGAVYRAEHVSLKGTAAAVKVLYPALALEAAVKQRFINEACASSRARHENIVQIFDGGVSDDGLCYVVMELLEGVTLRSLTQKGPIEMRRLIAIAIQVARGLGAAHDAGIVHRDLKPDNLLITRRHDGTDFVKVLDFGVAKLRDSAGAATQAGTLLGTFEYMAPEQWKTAPDLDGRADLYGLGVVLFLGATGQLPYRATAPIELMKAHLHAPVPDPSTIGPVPVPLSRLIQRMMAKDRSARPANARAVVQELESVRESLDRKSASLGGEIAPEQTVLLMDASFVREIMAGENSKPNPAGDLLAQPTILLGPGALRALGPAPPGMPAPPPPLAPAALAGDWQAPLPGGHARARKLRLAGAGVIALVAAGGIGIAVAHRSSEAPVAAPAVSPQSPPPLAPPAPVARVVPPELVAFDGGEFPIGWGRDGTAADAPAHPVSIAPFAIGRREVSMGEFRDFAERTLFSGPLPWQGIDDFAAIRNLPVNLVTRDEAEHYCAWRYGARTGRLPAEAEWEFAARGGQAHSRLPWSGTVHPERVNGGRQKHVVLLSVDSLPAGQTAAGLFHVLGNVAEWTGGDAAAYPSSTARIPEGTAAVRGGSARSTLEGDLTATARAFVLPDHRDPFIGFRCAMTLD